MAVRRCRPPPPPPYPPPRQRVWMRCYLSEGTGVGSQVGLEDSGKEMAQQKSGKCRCLRNYSILALSLGSFPSISVQFSVRGQFAAACFLPWCRLMACPASCGFLFISVITGCRGWDGLSAGGKWESNFHQSLPFPYSPQEKNFYSKFPLIYSSR